LLQLSATVTDLDDATACEAVLTDAGDDGDARACTYDSDIVCHVFSRRVLSPCIGAKTPLFGAFVYKIDPFAKIGSGQT
jgi:hypothetical protein